ncbi:MAG: YafY family transcriptional regulator [Gammaproteobacteria bacterium]|nr:YafY family transcriptional regulator [Gammaproteobacteria bacterium]
MRRADRLFQIVQILRGKPVVTAAELAERLEVSLRTIYRDMDDLSASGVPLRAEAGIGYALERGFDLPPLMFSREELEALIAGARLISAWGDPALRRAVESALAKIDQVLPRRLRGEAVEPGLYAPDFFIEDKLWAPMPELRRALREKRKFRLAYADEQGRTSERVLRPLAVYYWGKTWTLAAWCELRQDFRHFRLDRMRDWQVLDEGFSEEPGKSLADFMAAVRKGNND